VDTGWVTVQAAFTGAHLLHLAAAGCVLNDVYREAERLGITIHGVRVHAWGGFDTESWRSTGIGYDVEVDSPAPAKGVDALLAAVDAVAEVPGRSAPARRCAASKGNGASTGPGGRHTRVHRTLHSPDPGPDDRGRRIRRHHCRSRGPRT
jgi:hypothetical protein